MLTSTALACADLPSLDRDRPDPLATGGEDGATTVGWGGGDTVPGGAGGSEQADDQAGGFDGDSGDGTGSGADGGVSAGGGDGGATSASDTDEAGWIDPSGGEAGDDAGSTGDGHGAADGGDGDDPGQLAAAQTGLRLVEILPDPTGKDGVDAPELVEVLLLGPQLIPLEGLRLEARSWPVVDLGERLAPLVQVASGTRLLVERWTSDVAPGPDLDPSDGVIRAVLATSAGLRNADGGVLLRAADDTVVDAVSYGAPQPDPFPAQPSVSGPAPGEALCRAESAPTTLIVPSDLDQTPWTPCAPTPGAPSAPPSASGSGLALVEFHPHHGPLQTSGENNEFIELMVTSANSLDLDLQLRVEGVVRPLDALWASDCGGEPCALPGQRVLLVGDQYVGPFEVAPILFVPTVYLGGEGPIGPTPEIRIERLDGTVVTSLGTWGDPLAWPPAPGGDASLHRLLPGEPDMPSAWGWAAPSPHLP